MGKIPTDRKRKDRNPLSFAFSYFFQDKLNKKLFSNKLWEAGKCLFVSSKLSRRFSAVWPG
jgi:hypothetical protein